jgi:hypothetical protein
VQVLGNVYEDTEQRWYKLSDGTIVSFHIAYTDKKRKESVILVSDNKTWPSITAAQLGLTYTFMRNATPQEISEFLLTADLTVVTQDGEEYEFNWDELEFEEE